MLTEKTTLHSGLRLTEINSDSHLHLLIIKNQRNSQTISLKEDIYSIGRSSNNSIVIDSKQVSRIHATLLKKRYPHNPSSYCLIDGQINGRRSTNGIFVNSKKYYNCELIHGDVIEFSTAVRAIYQEIPLPLFLEQQKRVSRGQSCFQFTKKLNFLTLHTETVS